MRWSVSDDAFVSEGGSLAGSAVKGGAIFFFSDCAVSASLVVTPLFARSLGASNLEIGLIGAVYGLSLLVSSYLSGWASDVFGRERLLRASLAVAALTFPLQAFSSTPLHFLLVRGVAGFCSGVYPTILAAQGYEESGRLGRIISFGALGWGIGSLFISFTYLYRDVFIASGALFLAGFLVSLKMEIRDTRLSVPLFPRDVIKRGLPVYVSFLLRHTGANAVWAIFPLFLEEIGAGSFWIGVIYATNTFAQFFIMPLIDRFKSSRLVAWGLIFSLLTFTVYLASGSYVHVLPAQLLLALSWSLLYIGSLTYVAERGSERGTAVGVLEMVRGVATTIGPFFGGAVSQVYGYRSTIMFAVAGCVAALALFLTFTIRERGSMHSPPINLQAAS
ncbi:MAG: MFS transporter [Candidatus Freyarchaeota archaeon]|nr:MFS transporter [Candidatus Jordarchaeia archaeon]